MQSAGMEGASMPLEDASEENPREENARMKSSRIDTERIDGAFIDDAQIDDAQIDGARIDHSRIDDSYVYGARIECERIDTANRNGATMSSETNSTVPSSSLLMHALTLENVLPRMFKILGASVMLLATASYATNMTLADLLNYVEQVFSYSFVLLFIPLVFCAGYALMMVNKTGLEDPHKLFWFEVGQQAANGMSTLALTFTLLGISVGIGTLSKQSLTPDTVNEVIAVLTQQFSMAFMTTVVGLPTATLSRALLSISMAKPQT